MIINFIIKALCEQDSVYIGGLGLFGKQQQSAQLCEDKILPPSIIVTFDPNAQGDDYAFALFLAKAGGMVISKASMEVEKWVEQLNTALDNNKSVSFEGFGCFSKSVNGIVCFESEVIPALNIEFEGMGTIDNLQLTIDNEELNDNDNEDEDENDNSEELGVGNEELNENDDDNNEELGMRNEELNENENEKQEQEKPQGHSHSHSKKHKHRHRRHISSKQVGITTMIIVIVLALAACVAYLFRYDVKDFVSKCKEGLQAYTSENSEIDTNEPPVISYTDTADTVAEDTTVVEEEPVEVPSEAVNTSKPDNSSNNSNNNIGQYETKYIDYVSGKHYVIVGSFPSEKDVDRHIRSKHLERFNPKIVKQEGVSNLRVCIGIFDSEAEAESFGRNCGHSYWILN